MQTRMKTWEFCEDGLRPNQAIKAILSDLSGKIVYFAKRDDAYELLSLEMKQFSNGEAKYWRLVPTWTYYGPEWNIPKNREIITL